MRDNIHNRFSNIFPNWKKDQLVAMFGGPEQSEKWTKAMNYTRSLDKIRNQNMTDILTEFKFAK